MNETPDLFDSLPSAPAAPAAPPAPPPPATPLLATALWLKPALADGLIEMTIPHKPNSRLQNYCLTDKGRQWLAQHRDG